MSTLRTAVSILALAVVSSVVIHVSAQGRTFACQLKKFPQQIKKRNCVTFNFTQSTICHGFCRNSVQALIEPPYYRQECSCCAPAHREEVPIDLLCIDGIKGIKVYRATSCVCTKCPCSRSGSMKCFKEPTATAGEDLT